MFGGPWKVPNLMANGGTFCLVANGRSNVWWPLEGEGKTSFSPFSFPPPTNFTSTFFPLILKFYFNMVLDRYFTFLFPFP
jgi:hypothetical protein